MKTSNVVRKSSNRRRDSHLPEKTRNLVSKVLVGGTRNLLTYLNLSFVAKMTDPRRELLTYKDPVNYCCDRV
jgi:hypothetical protein